MNPADQFPVADLTGPTAEILRRACLCAAGARENVSALRKWITGTQDLAGFNSESWDGLQVALQQAHHLDELALNAVLKSCVNDHEPRLGNGRPQEVQPEAIELLREIEIRMSDLARLSATLTPIQINTAQR